MVRIASLPTYPSIIWWMLSATGVTRATQFMVMPFMALYMSAHTHATPGVIGLAVGTSPLCTTLFSFVGGTLSDRYGRKGLMVLAMMMNAAAMYGFANAHAPFWFFVISALTGLSRALFDPASQAMMTDVIPVDTRASVFALDYWMANIGASIGPIVGAYFGTVSTGWTFYLSGSISVAYGLVILFRFPPSQPHGHAASRVTFAHAIQTVRMDKALLLFIIGMTITSLGYSQIETSMPQMMQLMFGPHAAAVGFAYAFAGGGIEVVTLQYLINRMTSLWSIERTFTVSQTLYAVGFVGIGLSTTVVEFVIATLVLTIGEIMISPRTAAYVAGLADERMRGAYFGANSLTNFGLFLGPFAGGVLFHHFGGTVLFVLVGLLVIGSIPLYRASVRLSSGRGESR